jgi:hypothetical protein
MFAFVHLLNNPVDLILFYPATQLPLRLAPRHLRSPGP